MKKKIALFLAFSMMLSILPLNVFASAMPPATVAPLPFGGHTGSLLERNLGPATNLRHMEDGTLVGLENNVGLVLADSTRANASMKSFGNLVRAPGGNMRHIVVSGQYFMGRNHYTLAGGTVPMTSTRIVMDIHNVEMWLGRFNAINTNNRVKWTAFANSVAAVASTAFDGEIFQVAATSMPGLFPETETDDDTPSLVPGVPGAIDIADVPAQLGTPDKDGRHAELTAVARTLALQTNEQQWFWEQAIYSHRKTGTGATGRITDLDEFAKVLRTESDPDDSLILNIRNALDGKLIDNDITTIEHEDFQVLNFLGEFTDITGLTVGSDEWIARRDSVANAIAESITLFTNAHNKSIRDTEDNLRQALFTPAGVRRDIVFTSAWNLNPSMGVVVSLVDDTRAEIFIWRNRAFNDAFINDPLGTKGIQAVPYFSIPIEYVTNGDSNDEPIYLTFQEQTNWPQVGENNRRTDLTTNSESRFSFSTKDDPRVFHRYGRGEITGIRIEEAAQEAFDQRDWWVEFEIVSTGFYWTQDSIDRLNRTNGFSGISIDSGSDPLTSTRYDNLTKGRDIRDLGFPGTALRTPNEGSSRFTQVAFPITLNGQTNNDRYVNDWFQINNLSIGATDRARPGDVEVEVRLYRLGNNLDSEGWWQWNPAVYTVGETPPDGFDIGDKKAGSENPLTPVPTWSPNRNDPRTAVPEASHTNAINNGQWLWIQAVSGNNYGPSGDPVDDGIVTVARFGEVGLELFVHEDDDVEQFALRSGMREWDFLETIPVGESRPIGAVLPQSSRMEYHQTARAVLRETAPGSLPATGAHPTSFHFVDGIQVLGARLWANDAAFSAGHNDADEEVWFGNEKMEADNFINATIERNSVVVRPEIGDGVNRRYELAQITAEFYLSVQPGFEHLYGEDIEVTVVSGTVEAPFEGTLTIAYAWDPIQVTTQNIVLDENDIEAAQGVIRGIPVSDITITETRNGELMPGQRIWIGLEGGIGRAWNQADSQTISATSVEVRGDTQFAVTPISLDSHGFYVEVTRASREDGAQIVFSGVEVSGRVVPDNQYHLIVADTAAAHNWEGWGWIHNQAASVGFTRGVVRGFFNEEPYLTPIFRFEGAEFYAPPTTTLPGQVTPPTTGPTTPNMNAPVTLGEWMGNFPSVRVPGRIIDGPPLILVPNLEDPSFQTSYVMFAVVADLLGIQGTFDEATRTGTFSNGTTTVLVTNGQTTASVNGVSREIRTARSAARPNGLLADARIINDRFYVPITFFRDVVPEFPISLAWNDAPAGSRSVTVTPR